jgi:hypothetical protein
MNTTLHLPLALPMLASAGQAVAIVIYLLVLAGIIWMPKWLRDEGEKPAPWWKNVRFWAGAICVAQVLVYALLG